MLYGRLTLVAGDPGEVDAMSIWEGREAMEAAEARGAYQRTQAVQKSGGTLAELWTAEVVAARVSPQRPQARRR